MSPATVVVRKVGLFRILLVIVLALALFYRYFVAPTLDAIDRVTPWAGVLPGSCTTAPTVRSAGFSGMANDAGLALRKLAAGPPTPVEMAGWFSAAGREAKTLHVAFEHGVGGRQLLPLARTPEPLAPMQVNGPQGSLSPGQVALIATQVGWPAEQVPHVVARVMAESGGNPNARDYADGTHHGLLQLGTAEQARYLDPGASAFDPAANLRGALRLWQERGWQPWRASDSALRPIAYEPVQPVACQPTDPGVRQTSTTGNLDIVAFGRRLEAMGARVREHPEFGGVAPVHKGRGHYEGRAIDVNTRAGTSPEEQAELAPMADLARREGYHVLFMVTGHYGHLHVEVPAAKVEA